METTAMITTLQPELDTITDPRRRRKLLESYTDADLKVLRDRYGSWGSLFPSGAVRKEEVKEEMRRRGLAAEGA
jgi:hypothetical protein